MPIENFRYIAYSDQTKFTQTTDGRIELKKYSDDLLFYASFDSTINGTFGTGSTTSTLTGTATPENNGVFSQHVWIQNGSLKFDRNNFTNLTTEGSLQFRLKTDFNNAPGKQSFVLTSDPLITGLPDIDTNYQKFGGASLSLIGTEEKRVSYDVSNLSSMVQTGTVDFFIKANYTGAPISNIGFFDLYNGTNDNNRITITHETDGKMYFRVYDQTGTLLVNISFSWSADSAWHNISFNFDLNNGSSKAFVDGVQYGTTNVATATRVALTSGYIGVGSTTPNISNYEIDDFAIFNTVQHTTNFTIRNVALAGTETGLIFYAKYDTTIDLNVGTVTTHTAVVPATGNYSFNLYIDNTLYNGVPTTISLSTTDTMSNIFNKIVSALSAAPVLVSILTAGNIQIESNVDGASILITSPTTGQDLLQILGGVNNPELPNGPTVDTVIAEFSNGINNVNKISITHTTNSHIKIGMWDSTGIQKVNFDIGEWTNFPIYWYAFELDWNTTIGQFYIDGEMKAVFPTAFTRGNTTDFIIRSATTDFYRFDELIIYDKYKNNQNYSVPTLALTPYSADNPYIDVDFGSGYLDSEVTDILINSSSGCSFIIKTGNTLYYYYSGAWRESDGTYSQSITAATLETKFTDLYFDESADITIRVFFSSDGLTLQWIDEISIITSQTQESAATITGTVEICNTVNLVAEQHVIITTDQGTTEVDLTTSVPGLPAQTVGTADLSSGFDWATTPQSFSINSTTINLNIATTNINEVISLITPQIPTNIIIFTDGVNHIGFKTSTTGSSASMDLAEGTSGLATLGIVDNNYTGNDPDLTSVTLQEIKDSINAANVPGLSQAMDDGNCHLVLASKTVGSTAYVSISEGVTSNALPDIWGYDSSASGTEPSGPYFDYSQLYGWIRSMLGAPTVPVELTDEQLENCVGRSVYWYNYYRNTKEKLISVQLSGNAQEGYEIPLEVGGEDNIIEIIMRPRFPFAYYTGGDVNSILGNLYMQWMFQRGRFQGFNNFLGDYYITLNTEMDYQNILGVGLHWHFYNGKMFISPPPIDFHILISFRSALSMQEINTNSLIRSYALGEAKKVLGNIRATFGGVIPGGSENITLRGEALIAEGQQEVENALAQMKGLMEPTFLEWG